MAWLQALLIGLIALVAAPGYSFYFDVTPKAVTLLVGTAAVLVMAARQREAARGPRVLGTLLLANAASLALSTALSTNRGLSVFGGSWRCWGALMQCAAMLFAWQVAKTRGRIVVAGIAAGALIVVAGRGMHPPQVRPLLWRDTLRMAADWPLVGYGPETFAGQFPRFESRALAESDPDAVYESPRNIFLDALVSQGLPGAVLLVWMCVVALRAAWRRSRWLAAALAVGLAGLQLTVFSIATAVLFYCAVALAAAMAEEPVKARANPFLAGVAPFVVLALLYPALRIGMADHSLVVTRRLLAAGEYRATTTEYENYSFWRLPGASADMWYSHIWLDVVRTSPDAAVREQALEIAADAAARATIRSEQPGLAWFHRAQVARQRDDIDLVESSLRKAIAAAPNWYLPHWVLAQQLRAESRAEEAARETALGVELAGGRHAEIRPVYR